MSGYLELNSVAEKPLLGSFFNNPLIEEQLNSRYGLPQELRDVLLAAPVVLRVNALEAGRFQTSIQAGLMLLADQTDWIKRSLDSVTTALLKRGFQIEQRPCCLRMLDSQTVSPMFGSIPGAPPTWMVAELCNAGSGGAAAWLGGRHDHRPLTVEKGGTTAISPLRESGSIGSAGLARTGLASGDWQRISTGA